MLMLKINSDEVIAGGLHLDRTSRTVRVAKDFLETLLRKMVVPVFGERFYGRFPTMMGIPVPGQPHRSWVIMTDCRNIIDHKQDFQMFAVGLIDTACNLSGPVTVRVDNRVREGIFRCQPAITSPDGELLLPGIRISQEMEVTEAPELTRKFQGFARDGEEFLPVFDSHVTVSRSGVPASVRICREMPERRRKRRYVPPPPLSYVVWADLRAQRALWAFHDTEHSYWCQGDDSLEMIDISSMRVVWKEEVASLSAVSSLHDGRWAAACGLFVRIGYGASYEDLRVMWPRGGRRPGMYLLPLTETEWVIATHSWFMHLDGLRMRKLIVIPLNPVIYARGVLVTDDGAVAAFIPEDSAWTPKKELSRWKIRADVMGEGYRNADEKILKEEMAIAMTDAKEIWERFWDYFV